MTKLQITTEELLLLKTLMDRKYRQTLRAPAKEQASKTSQVISALNGRIQGYEQEELLVDRNDLRVLEAVTYNFRLHIETQELPELDRRIATYPEMAVKYQEYVDRSSSKLATVKVLQAKIEQALKRGRKSS